VIEKGLKKENKIHFKILNDFKKNTNAPCFFVINGAKRKKEREKIYK